MKQKPFVLCCSLLLWIVQAYSLSSCDNGMKRVYENNMNNITCTGLEGAQGVYWNIAYPNGTVDKIAECPLCTIINNTCSCNVTSEGFQVNRTDTSSRLQLVGGNDRQKDGATLTCSTLDGNESSQCQLKILYYTLPQCKNGKLLISEEGKRLPITCEGVGPGHSVNWTLTDVSGHVTDLAFCTRSGDCSTNDDVTASKTDSSSTLTFVNNTGLKDSLTLTCVRKNGGTKAECRINISDADSVPFPYVGAVVGTVVLVIIIVAIIVIVVARRRASRTRSQGNKTEPNAADNEGHVPYDNLQMSDVGIISDYPCIGSLGNVSSASTAESEEYINDLYQSAAAPTPSDQRQPRPAHPEQQGPQTQTQVSSSPQAAGHGVHNITATNLQPQDRRRTATTEDVYNVLGAAPAGSQKADQVYNHLTRFPSQH